MNEQKPNLTIIGELRAASLPQRWLAKKAKIHESVISLIIKPLHAGPIIRGARFFEKFLDFPCGSQIACACDGTNCKHRTVKKQHDDQNERVSHA